MKALRLHAYAEPPMLVLDDVPDPVPGPGQVLVAVRSVGLNPLDLKLGAGWMADAMPLTLPAVLGFDLAGVVTAVGAGVTTYADGDEILAMGGPPDGALAELVVLDAGSSALARKPDGLDDVTAATVPMVGTTAATIVRELQVAGTVLVIGATGGIGTFLVPALARDPAIEVIATAADRDADRVLGLGATLTVDPGDDLADWLAQRFPDGLDVVVDLVHQLDALEVSASFLRPGGQLISTLFGPESLSRSDVSLTYVRNTPEAGDLANAAALALAGARPPIAATVELAQATGVLAAMAAGATPGKYVITAP